MPDHIAKSSIEIAAPIEKVWQALTTPPIIKQYMFGADVKSDWKEGSSITWKGEWQGQAYEDKGKILRFDRERMLQYSHFSPLSGLPEKPENYHTVTIRLAPEKTGTTVSLTQDNNPTEQARGHSETNWDKMLAGLKKTLER